PAMPDASRLTVAVSALSLVSVPLMSRTGAFAASPGGVAPGAAPGPATTAAPGFAFGSTAGLAFGSMIGRAISADFSGVTMMSYFSWPYLASASARASAQLSPLRRQEQPGSVLCSNLPAF